MCEASLCSDERRSRVKKIGPEMGSKLLSRAMNFESVNGEGSEFNLYLPSVCQSY